MEFKPVHQTRPSASRAARRGFTLLEIIVVVTIIALLATLVAPRLLGNIGRAKTRIAQSEAASIAQQVNIWMADNGTDRLPDDFELEMLTEGENQYLRPKDLTDPWDNPYQVIIPGVDGGEFSIMSLGADGEQGGEGDNADIYN